MKTVSDNIIARKTSDFFSKLKDQYGNFSEYFFKMSDSFLHYPVDEYGKKVIAVSETVMQAGPIFNLFVENLDPAIMSTAEILDDINKEKLLSTDYFWKLQEKKTRYRRWLIVTNRLDRTIKNRIKYAVNGVLQEGGTVEDLQKDITSVFKKYNRGEAYNTATIARTEMNHVIRNTEYGYMERFSKEKKTEMKKSWHTLGDEKTRPLHEVFYKGQGWIHMKDYFRGIHRQKNSVIATRVRHPHDPKGHDFDVINCRCRSNFKAL